MCESEAARCRLEAIELRVLGLAAFRSCNVSEDKIFATRLRRARSVRFAQKQLGTKKKRLGCAESAKQAVNAGHNRCRCGLMVKRGKMDAR
jgi:hypothetical protein